ncbi:hypothetical protein, partial [Bacteroides xylanisolvens]|uniref:hypothetical protein n=1 Tax=Bacteroides xylanisolvens TaxID=371601 RepID=UPI0023080F4C
IQAYIEFIYLLPFYIPMPILINHTIYGKDKRCELISNSIFVSKNRKNRSYSIMGIFARI